MSTGSIRAAYTEPLKLAATWSTLTDVVMFFFGGANSQVLESTAVAENSNAAAPLAPVPACTLGRSARGVFFFFFFGCFCFGCSAGGGGGRHLGSDFFAGPTAFGVAAAAAFSAAKEFCTSSFCSSGSSW